MTIKINYIKLCSTRISCSITLFIFMLHLNTSYIRVDALCCFRGMAKGPIMKTEKPVELLLCLHIVPYFPIYGQIFVHHYFHYLVVFLRMANTWYCGCLRHHLKISTEVIKPSELRITPPPTHGVWTWRSVLLTECVSGCSGRAQVGKPVCGHKGGAEITHVFTYIDGCVLLNTNLQAVQ